MLTRICRICGEEKPLEELVKNKASKYGREKLCKLCANENNYKLLKNNPERRERVHEWQKNNPEKLKEYVRKWQKNNPEKIRRFQRKYKKVGRENLKDWYIKTLITNKSILNHKDIPQELIEAKRQYLKVKRKLKENENE